ncbi:MAG: hypothetical protein ACHQ4F_05570 [Candidatus Dormibacteria bacterium]
MRSSAVFRSGVCIDRLARSVRGLAHLLEELDGAGVAHALSGDAVGGSEYGPARRR